MEPDVGVDDNDVPGAEESADDSTAGPPTLRGRTEVPGLAARDLRLPGGLVHVVYVEVSSRSGSPDEDPGLGGRSGVRVEEVRPVVEIMEEASYGCLADSVGTCCHQGRRAYQEDKFIVAQLGIEEDGIHATMKPLDRKHQNNSTNIMLLAVFDGHGGDDCAHYCQENLQRYSHLFSLNFHDIIKLV